MPGDDDRDKQLRYRILGPVEVRAAGRWTGIGPAKWRALLATLVVHANQVVSMSRLLDELWGTRPPASGTKPLHVYVGQLRRALADPSGDRLVTRPPGYLLRVEPGELDAEVFHARVESGRKALARGAAEEARALLLSALALWHGPAMADVAAGPSVRADVARLELARASAAEARFDAELACGRHHAVLGELEALVAADPLRERLCRHLMVAMYRAGRRGDAIAAYQRTARRVRRDLGAAPSAELCETERAVRAGDPALALPPAAAPVTGRARRPWYLPPDVPGFTGRSAECDVLSSALVAPGRETAAVCLVDGPGGVGKSALAVHAAHRLSGQFPDGCLFADLHGTGTGARPLEPGAVLTRFLRALGQRADQIPADLDGASAEYRSLLAGRRILVVLDDAAGAAQLRPLLPAAPGNAVLVTSRPILSTVDAAARLHLEPLPADAAIRLLERLVGAGPVSAEPDAAAMIAGRCGGFPLALRIVGARIAARSGWSLGGIACRLADEGRRLDVLRADDLAVRSSFQLSYGVLAGPDREPTDPETARMFRLLGLLDCPDASLPACAALAGLGQEAAEAALERLVGMHLVESQTARRYRMHDLLRLFARERAEDTEPAADREHAFGRILGWYTRGVRDACGMLRLTPPGPDGPTAPGDGPVATHPLDWLETEQANLLSVARQAAEHPAVTAEEMLELSTSMAKFLDVWGQRQALRELAESTLRAAHRTGVGRAEAEALNMLGTVAVRSNEIGTAGRYLRRSLEIRRRLGDRTAVAVSLNNLGLVYRHGGDFVHALGCLEECLRIRRELGDTHKQGSTLDNIGLVYQSMGRHHEAIDHHRQSLALTREVGDRLRAALTLLNLGTTLRLAGRADEAVGCATEALGVCREFAHDLGVGIALQQLGDAHDNLGEPDRARAYWSQALEVFERLDVCEAEEVRSRLDG